MAIEFRIAVPDDARGVLKIYAPFCESTHVSFETVAPAEHQMRERIAHVLRQYPWIVAEDDGEIAGYVYATKHGERAAYRWGVDLAVYVSPAQRRSSLASTLYRSLFDILRAQGFFKAYAGIALPNEPSVGLHEALGFRHVATFPQAGYKVGRWIDVGWWQLDLQPETPNPADPRSFFELQETDVVRAALRAGARTLELGKYNQV